MKEIKKPHFGLHLTLDGYGCDPQLLGDRTTVSRFLIVLAKKLHLNILFGPKVVFAPGNQRKDPGGYSGFVIIQESHFSVHTFPKRKFVSIDVYSCRDFDYKKAAAFIKNFFRVHSIEINVVVRGRKYPQKNLL